MSKFVYFFTTNQTRSSNRRIHRPTKYIDNWANVLDIFSALLFVLFDDEFLLLELFYLMFCVDFEVEFYDPPFSNIMYIYVLHALRACHCRSKIDQCQYI